MKNTKTHIPNLALSKWECGIIHSAIGLIPAASINDIEILLRCRPLFDAASLDEDHVEIDIPVEDMKIILANIVSPNIQYPVNEKTISLFDKLRKFVE